MSCVVLSKQGECPESYLSQMGKGGSLQKAISRTQKGGGISLTFVIFQDHRAQYFQDGSKDKEISQEKYFGSYM